MHRLHQSQIAAEIPVTHEIVLSQIADAFYHNVHLCNNVKGMCQLPALMSGKNQSSTLPISMKEVQECCVARDRKFYVDQQLTSYLERNLISDAAASKLLEHNLKKMEDIPSLAAAVYEAWLVVKDPEDRRYSLQKFQNELREAFP